MQVFGADVNLFLRASVDAKQRCDQPLQSERRDDRSELTASIECGNSADFQGSATEENSDGIRHLTIQHSRHIVILP